MMFRTSLLAAVALVIALALASTALAVGVPPGNCSITALPTSAPQHGLPPNTPVTVTPQCATGDTPIAYFWDSDQIPHVSRTIAPYNTHTYTVIPKNDAGSGPTLSTTIYISQGGEGDTGDAVRITPSSLTFAPQTVGSASDRVTITITNIGIIPRRLDVYREGIFCPAILVNPCQIPPGWYDFSLATDCTPTPGWLGPPLPPGGTCTVDVTFQPSGVGRRTSGITVYAENIVTTPRIVLEGVGIAAAVPAVSILHLVLGAGLLGVAGVWLHPRRKVTK